MTEPRTNDGWSLVYRFDKAPVEQGNPSEALVEFMMPNAPTDELKPGARLKLFERETGTYADVVILD